MALSVTATPSTVTLRGSIEANTKIATLTSNIEGAAYWLTGDCRFITEGADVVLADDIEAVGGKAATLTIEAKSGVETATTMITINF